MELRRHNLVRDSRAVHASRITHHDSGITLMELLVVISIIALLSLIALPSLRGFNRSNLIASANRQLLDDLALARLRAISERTTVHVLFVSPEILTNCLFQPNGCGDPRDKKLIDRLQVGQYTSYALFAERTVGDQPGQPHFRYLTSWRTLPEGVFVATNEFQTISLTALPAWERLAPEDRPLQYDSFPFPSSTSGVSNVLAHVAFDAQGRIVRKGIKTLDDEVIRLARGSVFYSRNDQGQLVEFDARENPLDNSSDPLLRNWIRIDAVSGRAKIDQKGIE